MISTATALTSAWASRGCGPNPAHSRECQRRGDQYCGNEVAGYLVGQALDWRAAALGLGYRPYDLGQQGVGPNPGRAQDQRSGSVDGAAGYRAAALFRGGHGLPGQHGLIHRAVAFLYLAVHRNLLARSDAQAVAGLDLLQRQLFLAPAFPEAPGGLGGQTEQGPDRPSGGLSRAQLQHLTQQHQGDDHRRRFEVHRHATVGVQRCRQELREQRRHQAIPEGRAGAHGNERKHIEVAVDEGLPAADKERPAPPEHHWGGQRELNPVHPDPGERVVNWLARQHVGHRQQQQRHTQGGARPEAAPHVTQLPVVFAGGTGGLGLQRHTAAGARPRTELLDFRVHRTGIDGILLGGRLRRWHRRSRRLAVRGDIAGIQVMRRVGLKLRRALGVAEIVRGAGVLGGTAAGLGLVDLHAADRVHGQLGRGGAWWMLGVHVRSRQWRLSVIAYAALA